MVMCSKALPIASLAVYLAHVATRYFPTACDAPVSGEAICPVLRMPGLLLSLLAHRRAN